MRPFGVSLLIAGWDEDRPFLFQSDPSVSASITYSARNLSVCRETACQLYFIMVTIKTIGFSGLSSKRSIQAKC